MSERPKESLEQLATRLHGQYVSYWHPLIARIQRAERAGLLRIIAEHYPWWRIEKVEGLS